MVNNKLKLLVGLIITVIIFLLFCFWISSHGFLEITVNETPRNTKLQYIIFNQNGEQVSITKTTSHHFKKLLNKSTYRAVVKDSAGSYYKVSSTKGFLGTTHVTASLITERSRQFVGNNPNFCMDYGQDVLYSYDCGGGNLKMHLPATSALPTTTKNITESSEEQPIGLIEAQGKTKALVAYDAPSRNEDGTINPDTGVKLYDIDQELGLVNPLALSGISFSEAQKITAYKAGFVIYNEDMTSVKYFASPTSEPSIIKPSLANQEVSNAVSLTVAGNSIGGLFSSSAGGDENLELSQKEAGAINGTSEFVFFNQKSPRSYTFNKLYTSGGLCGDNKLCLINSGLLDVYDVSGKKPRYIFSMSDVQQALSIGKYIVIVGGDKIVALDAVSMEGSAQFSYGNASYCGLNQAKGGYVVCLLNKRGDKAALYVDIALADEDHIDKKVFGLLNNANVDGVSAYKNFIYISPALGELVYLPDGGGYGYDPTVVEVTNENINNLVRKLGIDNSKYRIINSSE